MADPGSGFGAGANEEFERLARQYWGAWGDALRNAVPGAASPDPVRMGAQAWHDAIDWWTTQATGSQPNASDTLWRFNRQASDWYAQMQQVAARFGGGEASAGEIVRAWKEAIGGASANVFADLARSMAGNGLQGVERWSEDAAPWLRLLRMEGGNWLHMPAFGFAREHQERLQALAEAQLEVQEAGNAYNTLLLKSSEAAFAVFERMLSEREAPGLQITSARALFDLWVDAAEQAYAEMALSKEYRTAYGNLANAQMKLRAGVQKEVELASASLGMPTRSELDGAHRKIVELERSLRRLRDQLEQGVPPASPPARSGSRRAPAKQAAKAPSKKAANARAKAKPARGSTAARAGAGRTPTKAVARKAAARPPAGRPRAVRKAAPRPATRSARVPTNGFSSAIPLAPRPMGRRQDA